jgi:hypothetical protein
MMVDQLVNKLRRVSKDLLKARMGRRSPLISNRSDKFPRRVEWDVAR